MLLRLTAQNRVRLAYKHTWRLPIAPSQNAHEFALLFYSIWLSTFARFSSVVRPRRR